MMKKVTRLLFLGSLTILSIAPALAQDTTERAITGMRKVDPNAINYTPKQGEIRVSVTTLGRAAILEVSDTGIGIPPESLPHCLRALLSLRQGAMTEVPSVFRPQRDIGSRQRDQQKADAAYKH